MQEVGIVLASGCAVGTEDVVGKENVGDAVFFHVSNYVLGEVSVVDDMDFLKTEEEETWNSIAETVFENDQATSVLGGCAHLGKFGVATHHRTVSTAMTILELIEERTAGRTALAYHLVVVVDPIDYISGTVFHALGLVIDEVFWSLLHGNVFGVAIHTANEPVYGVGFVVVQILERHSCHLCELLGGIESAKRCPMVVGAQVDGLLAVFFQRWVDINTHDIGVQALKDMLSSGQLRLGARLHFRRTIELH